MPRVAAALCSFILLATVATASGAGGSHGCILDLECGDHDPCDGIERCVDGACVAGAPVPCDDGDPCTSDRCETGVGCVHPEDACPADCTGLPDGTRCADGSVCTRGDACAAGACIAGAAVACDDGDGCTRDGCDPVLGCVHTEEADALPCVATCNGFVADYTPCAGDGDICTRDGCLPSVDLVGDPDMCIPGLLALERQCQDDDVCNGAEYCSPVLGCQPGPPLVCDDGESCNGVEGCDPALGCTAGTAEPDGTPCDDHHECTAGDACGGGVCAGAPLPPAACDDADAATADGCVERFGCVHCIAMRLGATRMRIGRPGHDRLRLRGTLVVPPGSFTPESEPAAVLVDDDASSIFRADLPAGSLDANAARTRFELADRRSAPDEVRAFRLRRHGSTLQWRTTVRDVTLAAPSSASVTVRLLAGGRCFSADASCAGGTTLTCR